MKVFLCMLLVTCLFLQPSLGEDCHARNPKPYRRFGSYTGYDVVRARGNRQENIAKCKARMIYMVARHGSRYPTKEEFEVLDTMLPRIQIAIVAGSRGSLCKTDFERLRDWTMDVTKDQVYSLSARGWEEMDKLGGRFRMRVQTVLNKHYDRKSFIFESSEYNTTIDSARGFSKGSFNKTNIYIDTTARENDTVLLNRPDCSQEEAMDDEDEVEEERPVEVVDAINGELISDMVSEINDRIGLAQNHLRFYDVEVMYKMCAFEHALSSSTPWCAAFSNRNLRILEDLYDMEEWYNHGPGGEYNKEKSCELVRQFTERLNDTKDNGETRRISYAQFTHYDMMLSFYNRIGMFVDEMPLTAEHFNETDRNFRVASIAPFSGNFVLVVFDCRKGSDTVRKLKAFINERPVTLPGCSKVVCEMSKFMDHLGTISDVCDHEESCNGASAKVATSGLVLLFVYSMISQFL